MSSFNCTGPCKQTKTSLLLASGEEALCLSCRNANRFQALLPKNYIRYSHSHYASRSSRSYDDDHAASYEEWREIERSLAESDGELLMEAAEWRDWERSKAESERISEERESRRSSMGHIPRHRGGNRR